MSVEVEAIRETMKEHVIDPELFVNVVDLGLVYDIQLQDIEENAEEKDVLIEMTLTSPACPAGPQLIHSTKTCVQEMEGVREVEVKLVMTPPWDPEMMTDDARDQLGIF
ncbi:Metal-sulfur cluster biosynthetic enzyme [Planctomycetales bacterium 10988]|nr:Metal-sulfur cluster biosynthetic enzyme [Planctomycetales bacterium 10988]